MKFCAYLGRLSRMLAYLAGMYVLWIPSVYAEDDTKSKVEVLSYVEKTPQCSPEIKYCFAIFIHMGMDAKQPVQSLTWIQEQVIQAQINFAANDISFQIESVDQLPPETIMVKTRHDRNFLGRERFFAGVIHVFVVKQLANVDEEGEIQGVHWRDRKHRQRRWIILSRIAMNRVLTHELGHFFGLPHSTYSISLMNKTLRTDPPLAERSFAPQERAKISQNRQKMLHSGMLINRKTSPALERK